MAFTEAQLLTEISDSGADPFAKIISFVNVSTTHTDVYVQNMADSKMHTGPWVQIAQTNTAAQAHAIIDAAMS